MKYFLLLTGTAILLLSCISTVPPVNINTKSLAPEVQQPTRQGDKTAEQSISTSSVKKTTKTVKSTSLSDKEIEKEILSTIPSRFEPVTTYGNHIKIIYHDLDNNGYKDAFFLVIKKRDNIVPSFTALSDVSRLADVKSIPIDYFLSVYLQIKGEMISMYRIPIGSRDILADFRAHFITKSKLNPFGLKISFLSKKGKENEWIFFSSYNRFSFFTTQNNSSIQYEYSDIDNNNIEDFIEWRHGLEEGTGYETFLTWYSWDGIQFKEKATTNIVRNLNSFLNETARLIIQKKWKTLYLKVRGEDSSKLLDQEIKGASLFSSIFLPTTSMEAGGLQNCVNFRSVIFPKILENPFKIQSKQTRKITLMVRFVCDDGRDFIRSVRVALRKNPFGKSEYFFIQNPTTTPKRGGL